MDDEGNGPCALFGVDACGATISFMGPPQGQPIKLGAGYSLSYALQGEEQIVHYMESKGVGVGFLIAFDARETFGRPCTACSLTSARHRAPLGTYNSFCSKV